MSVATVVSHEVLEHKQLIYPIMEVITSPPEGLRCIVFTRSVCVCLSVCLCICICVSGQYFDILFLGH